MSHKLDKKRHRRNVIGRMRVIKKRYLALTQNDTLAPDKALAALKDSEQLETAKRLARKLAARGVHVRLASDR
jgi:hypothetical protein